ncbi:hypothetical protein ADP8_05254 (plasmid) [Roseomonas mucosa]|nr:hypothetical protein ADP8_05254 [Roseomonas mucosa]
MLSIRASHAREESSETARSDACRKFGHNSAPTRLLGVQRVRPGVVQLAARHAMVGAAQGRIEAQGYGDRHVEGGV